MSLLQWRLLEPPCKPIKRSQLRPWCGDITYANELSWRSWVILLTFKNGSLRICAGRITIWTGTPSARFAAPNSLQHEFPKALKIIRCVTLLLLGSTCSYWHSKVFSSLGWYESTCLICWLPQLIDTNLHCPCRFSDLRDSKIYKTDLREFWLP